MDNNLDEKKFLSTYNPNDYNRPSVTVDTLLFTVTDKLNEDIRKLDKKELKILLVKRNSYPFKDSYAFPGGFVKIDESLDEAANRIIYEKANINDVYLEQLYTYGDINRDPRMRVLSVAYMSLVQNENLNPKVGRDSDSIEWFTIKRQEMRSTNDNEYKWILKLESEDGKTTIAYEVTETEVKKGVATLNKISVNPNALTDSKLAFDHYNILVNAIHRLKNKIEYTPIAFNLAHDLFTRSEIQSIYELILDKKLTRVELWRKIKDMVIETDMICNEKGHRPSKYYKFNPNYKYEY